MGSNALFTLLGIYLSTKIKPVILIGIDVICLLFSMLLLTFLVETYNETIWICAALVGAASSTIMPSAYTWANDEFGITWLFNSAFWCGFFYRIYDFQFNRLLDGHLGRNVVLLLPFNLLHLGGCNVSHFIHAYEQMEMCEERWEIFLKFRKFGTCNLL